MMNNNNQKPFTEAELLGWEKDGRTDMGGPENYQRLLATAKELQSARDDLQPFVDACIYYRNLAIRLGAGPTDMVGKADKELVEKQWCDEASQNTDDERTSYREFWAEVEVLGEEVARLGEYCQTLTYDILRIADEKEALQKLLDYSGPRLAEGKQRCSDALEEASDLRQLLEDPLAEDI